MIDREINVADKKDVEKYIEEVEKQMEMEKELQDAGTKINGGYAMSTRQLVNFFNKQAEINKKKEERNV